MSIEELYGIIIETEQTSVPNSKLIQAVCKKEILNKYKVNQNVVRKAQEYHLPEVFIIRGFDTLYVSTDSGKYSYSTFYYFTNGSFMEDIYLIDYINNIKKQYRDKRIDDILS